LETYLKREFFKNLLQSVFTIFAGIFAMGWFGKQIASFYPQPLSEQIVVTPKAVKYGIKANQN
jgi:hypothetical protein